MVARRRFFTGVLKQIFDPVLNERGLLSSDKPSKSNSNDPYVHSNIVAERSIHYSTFVCPVANSLVGPSRPWNARMIHPVCLVYGQRTSFTWLVEFVTIETCFPESFHVDHRFPIWTDLFIVFSDTQRSLKVLNPGWQKLVIMRSAYSAAAKQCFQSISSGLGLPCLVRWVHSATRFKSETVAAREALNSV